MFIILFMYNIKSPHVHIGEGVAGGRSVGVGPADRGHGAGWRGRVWVPGQHSTQDITPCHPRSPSWVLDFLFFSISLSLPSYLHPCLPVSLPFFLTFPYIVFFRSFRKRVLVSTFKYFDTIDFMLLDITGFDFPVFLVTFIFTWVLACVRLQVLPSVASSLTSPKFCLFFLTFLSVHVSSALLFYVSLRAWVSPERRPGTWDSRQTSGYEVGTLLAPAPPITNSDSLWANFSPSDANDRHLR